ncbi:hypothetical protein C882_0206 [Caenispirillum salinarum AK4]|uniref:histidine kinase n=1 Tax=Caenispirillum salinarum AK4 TaxID=1238182 RepID=K9HML0_9PROT|nr:response regulator [Caenispirillum salinarum]EKV29776.1 hypothetical protein C882_0206 [Caenispirillum salinarum AK4]
MSVPAFLNRISVRFLLVLLVALTIPFAAALVDLADRLEEAEGRVHAMLDRVVDQGVWRQTQVISQARSVVSVASQVPVLSEASREDPAACHAFLADLVGQSPWASGAWVADADGQVFCDSLATENPPSLSDRAYYREAMRTKDFVLSGYLLGKVTGSHILVAVQPVVENGEVRRLVGVSIDLGWYNDLLTMDEGSVGETEGAVLAVLDAEGMIVARQPNPEKWVGMDTGDLPHVQDMLDRRHGMLQAVSADRIDRMWHFRPLPGSSGAVFAVSLPMAPIHDAVFAGTMRGLAWVALGGLVTLGVAWLLLHVSVLRWTRSLTAYAESVGHAADPLRFDTAGAPREVQEVADAFHTVACRLKARDAELEALLQHAPVGFAFFDRDHRYLRVNQRLAEINGVSIDGHLGRTIGEALGVDGSVVNALVDRVFAERTALAAEEISSELPADPGRRRHWLTGWFPVTDETGDVTAAGTVVMEITELRKAEEALRAAKTDAEAANRAKSEFLANMSHEIRTPMTAILGLAHLLEQGRLEVRQRDQIAKIKLSAESLLGILNDILDFSKVEAGKLDINPAPFNLDRLLNGLGSMVGTAAEQRKLEVLFRIGDGVPEALIGDDLRLQQVLINLVGNAIKFTEEGEVVLSVRADEITRDTARLTFEVRDTGIGMTPAQVDNLFKAFRQGDATTTRRYGGTGLGLAISGRLVTLMGGAIDVSSTQGEGSTFTFTVTFGRDHRPSRRRVHSAEARHVLVVDDNPLAVEILTEMCRRAGWRATAATSGRQALDAAEAAQQPFDLVLMDLRMAPMDGLATARALRKAACRDATIVAVTAFSSDVRLNAEDHVLFDAVIGKPVTTAALIDAVELAETAPRDRTGADTKRLAGLRILVAEDTPLNQEVAMGILEQEGAEVALAEDGALAVAAVEEAEAKGTPFAVVLMDMMMPNMDGLEATRRLCARDEAGTPPVIAMSANALPADRERCLQAGMKDHVAKPLDVDQMVAVILRHARRAPAAVGHGSPGGHLDDARGGGEAD